MRISTLVEGESSEAAVHSLRIQVVIQAINTGIASTLIGRVFARLCNDVDELDRSASVLSKNSSCFLKSMKPVRLTQRRLSISKFSKFFIDTLASSDCKTFISIHREAVSVNSYPKEPVMWRENKHTK